MTKITATYSPEDNKIRLYPASRLDQETYERVKNAGYKWAPRQELFVAPKWTPAREDLAIELAGEIDPEEMSLVERAQAKAERLDDLANKRNADANAFSRAASDFSKAFEFGQPILIGHHSEQKARKTQEKMHNAQKKAVEAESASNYWLYRAEGVERHANRKSDPKVRARRIKTLLTSLRDHQRELTHMHLALNLWARVTTDEDICKFIGAGQIPTGPIAPFDMYIKLRNGELEPQECRTTCIDKYQKGVSSPYRKRWIDHILNRLSYERELLGTIERFDGQITPSIIQIFAREHGAHKPKASILDCDTVILESPAPLPLHLANDTIIEMHPDEWRDLMQSTGYQVPNKKPGKPPILNFKTNSIQTPHRFSRGEIETLRQVEMEKESYSEIYSEQRGTRISICGEFRFKVCPDPFHEGPRYLAKWVAVFLKNSKIHPTPESHTSEGAEA